MTQRQLTKAVNKNKDLREVSLTVHGKVVLKFASAYGFRNIQNVIRNLKRGKSQYDYVELMACPGGCLNGGGQIKPVDFKMEPKELLEVLEKQLMNMEGRDLQPQPEKNQNMDKLLQLMSANYEGWEQTEFHAIKKETITAATLNW